MAKAASEESSTHCETLVLSVSKVELPVSCTGFPDMESNIGALRS
jgi:hypothetical protein